MYNHQMNTTKIYLRATVNVSTTVVKALARYAKRYQDRSQFDFYLDCSYYSYFFFKLQVSIMLAHSPLRVVTKKALSACFTAFLL